MIPKLEQTSPYHHECDMVLWNAFKNGNKEAFAVIYYRCFKILFLRGLQISSDKELIKDCIHDLFVEIWTNKLQLATPDSVKAYLISSIRRKIIRQLKMIRSRQIDLYNTPIGIVQSKEDQMISEQVKQEQLCYFNRAINSLTKRQKEAIQLKFYSNLSYEEIAQKMEISTDSIYNLVSKAIDNLQQELSRKPEPKLL
jgi:RNA polymerase sigma factor (sigma-70 family)